MEVKQVADVVERELDRLRTARLRPYPRLERAENILVVDLIFVREPAKRNPRSANPT